MLNIQLLLFVAGTLAVAFTTNILITVSRRRSEANRLGYKRVTRYPHTRILGLDLHNQRMKALREGRLNRLYLEHFERFGSTWEENSYGERTINTIETANFQTIAALKFADFQKHPYRQKVQHPFSELGIFSSSEEKWRRSRDFIMPIFQRAQLNDVDSFKKFVDRFFAGLPCDGITVDLQPLLQRLFLDNSSEFIFGESLDSLRDTTGKAQDFVDTFDDSVQGMGKRAGFFNGRLNFVFSFDTSWKENYSKVHRFIDKHIARTYQELDAGCDNHVTELHKGPGSSQDGSENQRYVLIYDMAKAIRDPVQLRYELVNIFLPAREPNAIALSNTLFFLARNPEEWRKLRTQALEVFRNETELTFEVIQSLQDFRYALFEGMRLQGPGPRFQRMAIRDTFLPRGSGHDGASPVFVPKGTNVAVHLFSKFHDRRTWGEDVETFRPSRFKGKAFGWDFAPFFGGPRICPASQQVISQCVYLLVRMAAKFERIENRDECYEIVERASVFAESANGIKVALHLPEGAGGPMNNSGLLKDESF